MLPTVTQILRPFIATEFMTDEGRDKGTAVHDLCQEVLEGRSSVPNFKYAGYMISFDKFIQKYLDSYVFLEKRLKDNSYGFSGRPDGLFYITLRNDGSYIGDWKTGGMQKTYAGQLAGYWHLARKNGYSDCVGGFDLILDKDGKMARPVFVDHIEREFRYFLNALSAFKRYGG